ncbi:MAG: ribose-5-phosphate isomerase RpiA [Treponema sp.]|nr:ribose-5-phosphate isomerase RpiA [Treponema sp.]MCL2272823.1 ribose-5-phosphate isomerase RpiA [Treponema sp.]
MEQDLKKLMNEEQLKQREQLKLLAGKAAVDALVKSGMKLGLGTGSTAIHAVRRVGELLAQGTLRDICAFATSLQTEIECEKLGIPFYTLNSRELADGLDLTIDGADEIDPQNRLIKGGGGALLIEKVTAYSSSLYAIVADESKLTDRLGYGFPVPVEVIPAARVQAAKALDRLGAKVILREAVRKAGPVITEHGNIILDIRFNLPAMQGKTIDPSIMEAELNQIPGIVENGFFTRKPLMAFIARSDGTVETRPAV